MKAKNYFSTKRIAFLAMFVALVTVATMVVRVTTPGGQGYINVGDTLIFVCAVFFDPLFAFIAGGMGSALADVLAGWVNYAPFTFVVKGFEGALAAMLILLFKKIRIKDFVSYVIAFVIAGLWMAVGYLLSDFVLYGTAMAVASMPFNLLQAGANVVLGFVLAVVLGNMRGVRSILSLDDDRRER